MNELELLDEIQKINTKLDNNIELNDREYKLIAGIMFVVINDVIIKSFDLVLKIMKKE